MPARKRKAKQALTAINEDEDAIAGIKQEIDENPGPAGPAEEEQVRSTVLELREQVETLVTDELIEACRRRVHSVRVLAEASLLKLSKQVRQMSVAELFGLNPEEAAARTLTNVHERLRQLSLGASSAQQAAGAVQSALVIPGSSTIAQAVAVSLQQPEADKPEPKEQQQPPVGSPPKDTQAGSLMPPPPRPALTAMNLPARPPMQNEVVYSANGSPIYIAGAAGPSTSVKGAALGIAEATPAMGPSCVNVPQTLAFTGRTFRRAAVARGRTKQPVRAITVTTEDGKQFTVDDLIGLAGVPQKYRDEVRRLLEADAKDLNDLVKTVAAIEETDSVIPGVVAGAVAAAPSVPAIAGATAGATTRTTRRR